MRKLVLLNLAAASCLAMGVFGANMSFAKADNTEITITKDLPSAERIDYPESRAYQKPGAPVRYSYSMPKNIAVGQTISFDLRLSEPFDSGDLEVSCNVRGDVSVLSNSGNDNFSMTGQNGHEMTVTFTANSLGRHYLQFQAVSNSPEYGSRMRAFSIPVQVGPKQPLPPHPGLKSTPSGDMVISMQAIEEIK